MAACFLLPEAFNGDPGRQRIVPQQELLRLANVADVRNLLHVALPSGDAAERLAWTLPGVHAVTNRIALASGAAEPEAADGTPV